MVQLGYTTHLYSIHNLVPAALSCVYPVEASALFYKCRLENVAHVAVVVLILFDS